MKPKKRLGQNFLLDKNIIWKIIQTFDINPNDKIVEIGGGKGALTAELVKLTKELIVVEVDQELAKFLQNNFPDTKILTKDILECDFDKDFFDSPFRLIGNLPYYITSQIFFKVFDNRKNITDCLFMIQKEVADRLVATTNSKDYGILSVLTQYYADVKIEFSVSRNVFFPKPEVDSAVVSLKIKKNNFLDEVEERIFKHIVKTAFNQRRKTLKNSLQRLFETENQSVKTNFFQLDFDFSKRAEELELNEFIYLAKNFIKIQKNTYDKIH